MASIIPDYQVKKKRPLWLKVVLVVVALAAATGLGFGVRWLIGQWNAPAATSSTSERTAADDVQDLRLAGDTDAANKKIDELLADQSLDSKTRYNVYLQQGHAFADKQDYQSAIQAYKAAEQIDQTYDVAQLLAMNYQQVGNKTDALTYYKTALARIPAGSDLETEKGWLQEVISELEAQQ